MTHIAVLIGSPRRNGNTDLLARAFAAGAAATHTVDLIYVTDYHLHGCLGCNRCYVGSHICVQHDRMDELYVRLARADVIVFATPVYFFSVSAPLKTLIDRLHNPIRNTFRVKKLALLAVCADTSEEVFTSLFAMYRQGLRYFSLEDGGIITAKGVADKGSIAGSPALEEARRLGETI